MFHRNQLTVNVGAALPNTDRDEVEKLSGNAITALGLEIVAALLLNIVAIGALLHGGCNCCCSEGKGNEDILNKHFGYVVCFGDVSTVDEGQFW